MCTGVVTVTSTSKRTATIERRKTSQCGLMELIKELCVVTIALMRCAWGQERRALALSINERTVAAENQREVFKESQVF